MATYRNSANGTIRTTSSLMGYPWVEVIAEKIEIAAPTADAIMLAVGDDAVAAAEELAVEKQRETPRKTLIARLQRVISDAAEEEDE